MPELTFVTGNKEKYAIAQAVFKKHGLPLLHQHADIDEIQAEDGELIVRDKAAKAFAVVNDPVLVNDDLWTIPGLGGFPGPYMKSVLHWFSADDFLRLTKTLTDRRIILTQYIAYHDGKQVKVFSTDYTGQLLPEIRGTYGNSLQKITSMPGDNGLSVSEAYDNGAHAQDREVTEGWEKFIAWHKGQEQ